MAKIKIVSNMVFDVICLIEYICNPDIHGSKPLPLQDNFVKKIDDLTNEKLKKGFASKVNMCMAFTYYFREKKELEKCTLDDLAEFFENLNNVYDCFFNTLQEMFPGIFKKDYFDNMWETYFSPAIVLYPEYINILKEIDFEKIWNTDVLPAVKEEIIKKEEVFSKIDIDGVFKDIQKLKQCKPLGDVKIYTTLMSYPTACKLPGNHFLDTFYSTDFMGAGIIFHELMHGIMTEELNNLHLEYIKNDNYLAERSQKIYESQQMYEEDYVAAAEYYLRLKHNNETKEKLLKEAKNRYGGLLPISVLVFNLLSEEVETPDDYIKWLTDIFNNKKLPQGDIEKNLANIIIK
jgi:hypothetical protein